MATDEEREQAAAIERLRAKHDAYVALFGPPNELKSAAVIVLADLDGFCTTFRESVHMDQHGRMDPFTMIYRDGKKAVALRIRKMLEWSESDDDSNGSTHGE